MIIKRHFCASPSQAHPTGVATTPRQWPRLAHGSSLAPSAARQPFWSAPEQGVERCSVTPLGLATRRWTG